MNRIKRIAALLIAALFMLSVTVAFAAFAEEGESAPEESSSSVAELEENNSSSEESSSPQRLLAQVTAAVTV